MSTTRGRPASGARAGGLRTSVFDSVAAAAPCGDGWERLAAGGRATVFQTPGWLLPALRRLRLPRSGRKVRLVTVEDEAGLVMIAPLAIVTRTNVRCLEWLGDPMYEYGDVIARSDCDVPAAFSATVEALRARGDRIDVIHLRKVRDDAAIAPFVAANAAAVHEVAAPHVRLGAFPAFDAYLATRNPRTLKSLRRKWRGLEARGALSFGVHRVDRAARDLARRAIDFKIARLAERGMTSRVLADRDCVAALGDIVAHSGAAHVSALNHHGEPVAIEIGFVNAGRYYSYLGATRPDYAKFSPGSLQIRESMKWCHATGIERFDLLAPADDYKHNWSTDVTDVRDWAVALNARGALYARLVLGWMRPAMKSAYGHLPAALRKSANRFLLRLTCLAALVALAEA